MQSEYSTKNFEPILDNLIFRLQRLSKFFSEYEKLNVENQSRINIFLELLPKYRPHQTPESILKDYFSGTEFIKIVKSEKSNRQIPTVKVDFLNKEIPKELKFIFRTEGSKSHSPDFKYGTFDYYVYYDVYTHRFQEYFKKLNAMKNTSKLCHLKSLHVILDSSDCKFLHQLEEDLQVAERYLQLPQYPYNPYYMFD